MTMKKAPPERVWVTWCATCGRTITADTERISASGCDCGPGKARVKQVRYARVERTR